MMSTPAPDVVVHPLVALCSKLLTEFLTGEQGYPGRAARRSRWVDVSQLEEWQDQLAWLAKGQAAPASGDMVEVPADAEHRISLAALMPPSGCSITASVMDEIASWRPAAAPCGRARRWLSDLPVTTSAPSGPPWRGPLQVIVTPDGEVVVWVRNGLIVLPVPMSEVDGQAVSGV
jgi:hypothetical protein